MLSLFIIHQPVGMVILLQGADILKGLVPNADGLYRLEDLENRFVEAISAY